MRLLQAIGFAFNLPSAGALRVRELKLIVAAADVDLRQGGNGAAIAAQRFAV